MAKQKAKNSQKTLWIILLLVFVVLAGIFVMRKTMMPSPTNTVSTVPTTFDFANRAILLNNQELVFSNGSLTNSDATYGQHTANITNRSVNPTGTRAAAVLIDNPGGSGTFYYLVGAMLESGNETYSDPVLLGDRIKIVSVTVDDPGTENSGIITVEYLDRPVNAPMAAEPTVQTTAKYAFQDDGNLIGVLN